MIISIESSFRVMNSRLVFIFAVLVLAGCASRPTLAPNDKLESVTASRVKSDIDRCLNKAKLSTEDYQTALAKDRGAATAASSAARVSAGAVSGATNIGGLNVRGSASRGVRSAVNDLLSDRSGNPAYRQAVERCLQAKGYVVSGWS